MMCVPCLRVDPSPRVVLCAQVSCLQQRDATSGEPLPAALARLAAITAKGGTIGHAADDDGNDGDSDDDDAAGEDDDGDKGCDGAKGHQGEGDEVHGDDAPGKSDQAGALARDLETAAGLVAGTLVKTASTGTAVGGGFSGADASTPASAPRTSSRLQPPSTQPRQRSWAAPGADIATIKPNIGTTGADCCDLLPTCRCCKLPLMTSHVY